MSDDFTGVMESMAAEATDSAGSPPAHDESNPAEASASPAEPSASATAPATTPTTTESQTIPYVRFREVNEERTRYKESLDKLKWAEAIPDTAAPAMVQFYQELTRDPIGTLLREVEGMMQGDPTHAQAVRSAAARWMGSGQATSQTPAMPEPDLQTNDGTLVYSAGQAQKLSDWRDGRLREQMTKEIQPLQQWAAQQQAQHVRSQIEGQAKDWAKNTYAQWSARPHFADHKAEIADLMERHGYGIADAYAEMLTTTVFPTLQHATTSGVVAALHQKAAAGTTNPSRGPAQTAGRPSSFGEAMAALVRDAG